MHHGTQSMGTAGPRGLRAPIRMALAALRGKKYAYKIDVMGVVVTVPWFGLPQPPPQPKLCRIRPIRARRPPPALAASLLRGT